MRTDAQLLQRGPAPSIAAAQAQAAGYHTMWIGESQHDPFLRVLKAAESTTTIGLGTSIAVAFSRNPMTVASTAYDLAEMTEGRFILGLGTQVKAHIERRFSMPWSHPAPRMNEFVRALKAIWSAWEDDTRLDFRGEFYTHTLMASFFAPPKHQYGPPAVYLAGVGEIMMETVGEVADGWFWHPFTTREFLQDISLPALARGRDRREGNRDNDFTITGPAFVTTGRDDQELDAAIAGTKKQIAFYASTPAYKSVLDHHGWGDLQPELTQLSKKGLWDEMTALIHDDLLHAMSVVGSPAEAGAALRKRWESNATSLTFYSPYESDPSVWPIVAEAVRG